MTNRHKSILKNYHSPSRCYQIARNFDIFGHPISLNFDNFETTRKTTCGGCFTMLTLFIIIYYFLTNITKIGQNRFSQYQVSETTIDFQKESSFRMDDMSIIFFLEVKNVGLNNSFPLSDDEDVKI